MKLEYYVLLLLSILATNAAPTSANHLKDAGVVATSNPATASGAVVSSNSVLERRGIFSRKKKDSGLVSGSDDSSDAPPQSTGYISRAKNYVRSGAQKAKSAAKSTYQNGKNKVGNWRNSNRKVFEADGPDTQTTENTAPSDDESDEFFDASDNLDDLTDDGSTSETTGHVEDDGNSVPVGRLGRIRDSAARAGKKVNNAARATGQRVNNAARATGQRVNNAARTAGQKVYSAARATGRGARTLYQNTQNRLTSSRTRNRNNEPQLK